MKVKPFRGIRPPKALAKQVSSRPYDVLNSEEARHEAEGTMRIQEFFSKHSQYKKIENER